MYSSTLLSLLAVPLLAVAQYDYGGSGGSKTTSSAAAAAAPSAPADTDTHKNVNVGLGGMVFSPSKITAKKGTLVTFWFPGSVPHSVTQSSFADPCTYLASTSSTPGGFDSGLTTAKQFTINITDDTKPIWYFCKTAGHCGAGMVGSINAPDTGNTFDLFESKAKSLGSNAPSAPADKGAITGGVNGVATAAPSAASSSNGNGNNGAISLLAGTSVLAIVAGVVVALL